MAALLDIVKKDSTDRSVAIRIIDSSDGTPETGVVFNTSGIDLWYRREGGTKVSITEADLSTPALDDAHTDGGFLHISDGEYRLDLPDAAFATGANYVDVGGTVTGMVVIGGRVRLVDYDLEDATRMGLTALPNAAADAAGGLPISDAGGLDLDTQLAATNEVTAARMGALTDWINGGRLDLLLDAIKAVTDALPNSGALTDLATASALTTVDTVVDGIKAVTDNLPDSGALSSLATASALSTVDSNVDAILVDTAEIGAAGAGLTAIPWNSSWDAEVQSECADALADYSTVATTDLPTNFGDLSITSTTGLVSLAADQSGVTVGTANALGTQAKADVNAEVDTALADIHLDHLLAADYDPSSKPGTSTALLNELVENDSGVSRFTTNALEQAPTGGSAPSAADIRTEIDNNSTQLAAIVEDTGTTLPGTLAGLSTLDASGVRTAVGLASANLDTQLSNIVTDTNELQGDLTDGGRLDLLIDAIKAKTDNLPASPAAVGSEMALEDGAITAAKIASDAITAAKIAADAVTEIQNGLATAAKLLAYVQLMSRSDSAITTDNSTELSEINADGGSGGGDFAATADSLEAIRNRGDNAWTTGVGGSSAVLGGPNKSGGKQ